MFSEEMDFQVDTVEVWRIGPKPESGDGVQGSVLDNSAADQALLEMAGKKMHSKDLREPIDSEEVIYLPNGKVKRPVY
jgi:hypothetical protein